MDAEAHDDAAERRRDDDPLEDERERRRQEKVRRVLDIGLPGDGQRQHDGMQGEDVEERIHAVLVEEERS